MLCVLCKKAHHTQITSEASWLGMVYQGVRARSEPSYIKECDVPMTRAGAGKMLPHVTPHRSGGETTARVSRGVVGSGDKWMRDRQTQAHSLAIVSESRAVCGMGGMGLLTFSPPWQREL